MNELSSQAVKTGSVGEARSAVAAPAAARAARVWPRRDVRRWRYSLLRRMLALADVAAALLASFSLVFVGSGDTAQLAWSLILLPLWVVVAKLLGLYDHDQRSLRHLTIDEVPQLVLWALVGASCLSLFLDVSPAGRPQASNAVAVGVVAAVSAVVLRAFVRWLWRALTPPQRAAVIGTATSAAVVRRKLELFPDLHTSLVEERQALDPDDPHNREWLGTLDRLIFAPGSLDEAEAGDVVELARESGVILCVVPPCHSIFGPGFELNHLAELPLIEYRTGDLSRSTLFLKRALDVTVSAVTLGFLWPIFLVLAAAIKLDSPGPVFFSQLRAGEDGRAFAMVKFRTMVADAEALLPRLVNLGELPEPVFKLDHDPRVTRVGRLLRRWSLDELPQLWNVLLGHMSLVGPRPEEIALVKRYTPEQRVRLAVRPGITGPMQVYGRGALTLTERIAVERDYIENFSIGRDLRILGATIAVVVRGRGAF
jgi:exopolysaccharide biosynthesis polyprenyl glycosylphosphotransferase